MSVGRRLLTTHAGYAAGRPVYAGRCVAGSYAYSGQPSGRGCSGSGSVSGSGSGSASGRRLALRAGYACGRPVYVTADCPQQGVPNRWRLGVRAGYADGRPVYVSPCCLPAVYPYSGSGYSGSGYSGSGYSGSGYSGSGYSGSGYSGSGSGSGNGSGSGSGGSGPGGVVCGGGYCPAGIPEVIYFVMTKPYPGLSWRFRWEPAASRWRGDDTRRKTVTSGPYAGGYVDMDNNIADDNSNDRILCPGPLGAMSLNRLDATQIVWNWFVPGFGPFSAIESVSWNPPDSTVACAPFAATIGGGDCLPAKNICGDLTE